MTPINPYRFVFECMFGRAENDLVKQIVRKFRAKAQGS